MNLILGSIQKLIRIPPPKRTPLPQSPIQVHWIPIPHVKPPTIQALTVIPLKIPSVFPSLQTKREKFAPKKLDGPKEWSDHRSLPFFGRLVGLIFRGYPVDGFVSGNVHFQQKMWISCPVLATLKGPGM